MLRLYDSRLSGNCWKVRILLHQLGREFERITLDLATGDHRQPAFRKISRFSRVPVLVLEDGRAIVESGAILLYLAEGSSFLPADPYLRSEVASWLFFEQADLQKAIAVPRVLHLTGRAPSRANDIERCHAEGYPALQVVEDWLANHEWLVDGGYTIADLAVFGYVSMADQAGYDMGRFAAIHRWSAAVRKQPGWVPLLET